MSLLADYMERVLAGYRFCGDFHRGLVGLKCSYQPLWPSGKDVYAVAHESLVWYTYLASIGFPQPNGETFTNIRSDHAGVVTATFADSTVTIWVTRGT